MTVLKVYQYVGPMILFPTSYYLWLRRVDYDHQLVLFMMSMPILYAYIIPAIGTNWLKLWEFKTRWRLGRFRPHNGFVFGSAISLFALFLVEPGEERALVNYRVRGDYYVVDKLFDEAVLVVGVGRHAERVTVRRDPTPGILRSILERWR